MCTAADVVMMITYQMVCRSVCFLTEILCDGRNLSAIKDFALYRYICITTSGQKEVAKYWHNAKILINT